MPSSESLPQLLTIDQLAERLGVSIRHIRRLVAERRVPYLKVGWLVRFDPAEITAWLDSARHPERSTAGDRTRLAVSFSRSASRIREIGRLDSGRQTDCARLGDFPLVAEDLRDALE
ncbi:MAG: helix-turn-helix domain-containing protein [Acidimicrobiales bacterium]|jgi:excisionase family DNA binding protein